MFDDLDFVHVLKVKHVLEEIASSLILHSATAQKETYLNEDKEFYSGLCSFHFLVNRTFELFILSCKLFWNMFYFSVISVL